MSDWQPRARPANLTILEGTTPGRLFLRNIEEAWVQAQELFPDADRVLIQAFRMQDPIGYLRDRVSAT